MEAISGTASVLQLLAAAITVTETTLSLLRAISDAPRELQEIAIKVSIIQSQLQQLDIIKTSVGRSEDRTLSPEFRNTIALSLEQTRLANVELQDAIRPLQTKNNFASRVHWALLDRSKVAVLSQRLLIAEQSLSLSLRILEIQISLNLKTAVLAIHQDVDELLTDAHKAAESRRVAALAKTNHPFNVQSTHYYFHPSFWRGRAECSSYTVASRPRSTCTIDIPLLLPCVDSRVLRVRFGLQHLSTVRWGFQLERISLSVKRLVRDDSDIIRSCRNGDFVAVQKLLQDGKASANDVTLLGLTPLMCAIESGRLGLVQFLVAAGADVNAQMDQCNTNTLQLAAQHCQLDIFRYLLRENVDTQHVDDTGWTVPFHLWPRPSTNKTDRSDFLKLLHHEGGCNISLASGNNTALHRAAHFGTPSDISTLVRYGADSSLRVGILNWAPIHNATIGDNTEVVAELVKPRYRAGINTQDARGWSPLHVAAYAGKYSMLCTLLRLGADMNLRSWQVGSDIPLRVTTKEVTAAELARLRGEKQHAIFLQAVQAVKGSNPPDGEETFWDAVETI